MVDLVFLSFLVFAQRASFAAAATRLEPTERRRAKQAPLLLDRRSSPQLLRRNSTETIVPARNLLA